ncbi:hypothetical protein [Streptomyces sp. CBMA29]|uniref:hypothetical protein n=1 Tax=Streptomyces sp. CBMA29 TaxID=1896314 RepID=UPI001661F88C|nr:hypothetical protein [Streptomyces sp. CBMA29]MBD0739063.1 hypothetical protein [Streptomyces sp. CBMA29]
MNDDTPARIPFGTTVRDLATGRVGILRDLMDPGDPYGNAPQMRTGTLAYLAPAKGGVEWTTDPDQLERVN